MGEIVVSGAWRHRTNARDNVSQLVYLVEHMTYCCLLLLVFLSIYYMLCACIYRYVPKISTGKHIGFMIVPIEPKYLQSRPTRVTRTRDISVTLFG